jgi:uncharacterized protein YbjT (DUF2867 family)
MKSRDNICTSGPIPFPPSSRSKVSPVTEEDRAIAREHDAEIYELCRDTTLALQELRHRVAHVLLDTLEKMDLDVWTLVQLLDERPSVVRDLMDGETDDLTTETMIEYLEKLRR